jgi:hypothetical protein
VDVKPLLPESTIVFQPALTGAQLLPVQAASAIAHSTSTMAAICEK